MTSSQTSILKFYKDLEKYGLIKDSQFILNIPLELLREIFDKSEILHKHQIIDAYYEIGRSHPDNVFIITKSAEEYYTSTFGSNGSDEKIISQAHTNITRIKGKEYAPTSNEIQTAVEYIIEQLQAPCRGIPSHIIEQAKEMEYKQTMEAMDKGVQLERNYPIFPKTISDEEIEKAAFNYAEVYQCPTEIKMCKHDVISAWNKAIQWYREQLKSKGNGK